MNKLFKIMKMVITAPFLIFTKRSPFVLYDNAKINKKSAVLSGTRLHNICVDKYSYIGRNCLINNSEIGSFCSISDNCTIGLNEHPTNWVSTSPVFINGKNILRKNFSSHEFRKEEKTKIGNDVWIGGNVLIKSGISIGNGAIIGAGAVVTNDVPDYAIFAGVPAKLVRYRFEEKYIDALNNLNWWQFEDNKIAHISKHMNNIGNFLDYVNENIEK